MNAVAEDAQAGLLLRAVIGVAAPDELPFVDEILGLSSRKTTLSKAEAALSFGIEVPIAFLTPVVAAVLVAVNGWLGQKLAEAGINIAENLILDRMKKWISGIGSRAPPGASQFSPERLDLLRQRTIAAAIERGLSDTTAENVANALVASLVIDPV